MHNEGRKSFPSAVADEFERRWCKEQYDAHNRKPLHWYDFSRRHLNFEVSRDGKIRPLGTSESCIERYRQRLEQLGEKEYPEPETLTEARNQKNLWVDFVFGGDHELMCRMAFGKQFVDFDHDDKVDNTSVVRKKEIERWALDLHSWLCEKYGAENVVGFQVHCDEATPHAHVQIIPTQQRLDKKTGEMRECISMKSVFGKSKDDWSEIMKGLHTELYEKVNFRYGLNRGDPVEGRDVHHKSKYEMFMLMKKQIPMLETKIKGLTTMVNNLEHQIGELNAEVDELNKALTDGRITLEAYKTRKADLDKQLTAYEQKLKDKRQKLMDAMAELNENRKEALAAQTAVNRAEAERHKIAYMTNKQAAVMAKGIIMDDFIEKLTQMFQNVQIPDTLHERVKDSFVSDFFDGTLPDVLATTLDILAQTIDGVTTPTPSVGGGGGSSSGSGWGKDDDEDWADYISRVARMAHKYHSSGSRKTKHH